MPEGEQVWMRRGCVQSLDSGWDGVENDNKKDMERKKIRFGGVHISRRQKMVEMKLLGMFGEKLPLS